LGFEGYLAAQGKQFHNVVTSAHSVRNIGKIAFNPEHPFFADYAFLAEAVGDRAVAKVSIPSPNQLIRLGFRNEEIYPTLEEYAADLQQAYRDTILHFYSLGNRYIQIDDTFWGDLCSDKALEIFGSQETYDELKRVATENVKNIQIGLPEDLVVTTHICRGNFRSSYSQEGAYEPVAKELFGETGFDGFFLEYDTDRAGGFEPLRYYTGDGQIILGLITSKTPELEDIAEVKARITEATKYVPLEQLCLSPQCGFASTEEGNNLTEEQQWAKLALVKQIADEVWGD
jgi:5-methyltetrahydropteroyltriglutamate--homocysteine methyltransferase